MNTFLKNNILRFSWKEYQTNLLDNNNNNVKGIWTILNFVEWTNMLALSFCIAAPFEFFCNTYTVFVL